jgi:phosphate transport system permease protein
MSDPEVDRSTEALEGALGDRHLRQRRRLKDRVARIAVGAGGGSVIVALVLIFFYLLWVTLPLFKPASAEAIAEYHTPGAGAPGTLYLAMEEQAEVGVRITDAGEAVFFDTKTGKPIETISLGLPAGARILSASAGSPKAATLLLGLDDGRALVVKHVYDVSFPDNVRKITPRIEHPLGDAPITIDPEHNPLQLVAGQTGADQATFAALTADGRLLITAFTREESLLGDGAWQQATTALPPLPAKPTHLIIDQDQRELYAATADGELHYFDISDKSAPRLVQSLRVVPDGVQITSLKFLAGGISVLIGDSRGHIEQWFPVRDENNNYTVEHVRGFNAFRAPVTDIAPEFNRKGFFAVDAKGRLGVFHTTSHRTVLNRQLASTAVTALAVAPRGNAVLAEDAKGNVHFWHIQNDHPDVSWSALWGKVWYESYPKPDYVWQSSAASDDFEPKFSLVPITFGTIKAAFYAMLFAIPLAIMGAVFTAYFMAPRMRQIVKPTIEIMEALPTVILGFLAGLWLAPYVEKHLPGIFSLLLILPVGVLAFAYLWHRLPGRVRALVPEGWEGALLIPVLVTIAWAALAASQPVEQLLFGGDMRVWLTKEMGIGFDQRNSIIVGLAMGFAVIPTIFSIAEDAIFAVPRHLTHGSLALGATPWQTLSRVVILTASPGIFSAVMIGLGRAVGETMIVLMATGNTPIMDWSIFQGMRTLSANIAVEMPESAVNSTHYRVLFLAGMVLFLATFVLNTAAEIVRQRLRRKYSSL